MGRSLGALWSGAVGSRDAVMSGTLVRATPLVLAGIGVAGAGELRPHWPAAMWTWSNARRQHPA